MDNLDLTNIEQLFHVLSACSNIGINSDLDTDYAINEGGLNNITSSLELETILPCNANEFFHTLNEYRVTKNGSYVHYEWSGIYQESEAHNENYSLKKQIRDIGYGVDAKSFERIEGLNNNTNLGKLLDYLKLYLISASTFQESLKETKNIDELFHKLNAQVVKEKFNQKISEITKVKDHGYLQSLEMTKNNLNMLVDCGWQLTSVMDLMSSIKPELLDNYIKAFEIIADYKIREDATNKKLHTAKDIIKEYNSEDWYVELIRLGIDSNEEYLHDKSREQLFDELLKLNGDNAKIKEHIESGFIKSLLENIDEFFTKDSEIYASGKPIGVWEKKDILVWKAALKPSDVKIHQAEVIAVIKRAVELNSGFSPRDIQIISLIILYNQGKGMLVEIATGEGKTLINAMLASMLVFEGKKPDIVTSSPELAEEAVDKMKNLYNTLGITVGHILNGGIGKEDKDLRYLYDVVYGDPLTFVSDAVSGKLHNIDIRHGRGFELVIVDESDSAFIDHASQLSLISRGMPGFEYLEAILIAIWNHLKLINQQMMYLEEEGYWVYIEREVKHENSNSTIGQNKSYQILDREAFIRINLTEFIQKLIDKDRPQLIIPNHLKPFAKSQIKNWVKSAIEANYLIEKKDYDIITDSAGHKRIGLIDYRSTGIILSNTHYSDGLHQFLEIKHGLKLRPENLITSFMSLVGYFNQYGTNIYGLTGTLGGESEESLLKHMYGVDKAIIPTYKPKKLIELPPVMVESVDKWIEQILLSVKKEAEKDRAVLIILETILQSDLIETELKKIYPSNKIKRYTRNDGIEKKSIAKPIDAGEIIIATNIAGRGTDIKTTDLVEFNGGLHVCLGYLPDNLRVQLQAFGRTAREGKSGTAQMIINANEEIEQLRHSYRWFEGSSLDKVIYWRDLAENERLLKERYCHSEMAKLKDILYGEITTYLNNLRSKLGYTEYKGSFTRFEIAQIIETWGYWFKDQLEYLTCKIDEKIDDHVKQKLINRNKEIKEKVLASFEEFKDGIDKELQANNIMKNPGYLTQKGFYGNSFEALNRALAVDGVYSFAANYMKARKLIESDSEENSQAVDEASYNLQIAKQKIKEYIIPQHEGMIETIGLWNITQNQNALIKQYKVKIEIINKNIEYIDKALNVIKSANDDELLAISTKVPIKNAVEDGNLKVDEIRELYELGIDSFFEVKTYVPEKDDNGWFGSLFTFVLGVFQIMAGIALTAATGGAAIDFGAKIIVSGVSDIISSVKSLITREGINIDEYLKGKGINIVVDLILTGIESIHTSIKSAISGEVVKEEVKQSAIEVSLKAGSYELMYDSLKQELVYQGVIKGLGVVVDLALENVIENNQDDIEDNVRKHISAIFERHSNDLQKLLSSDRLDYDYNKQNALRNEAVVILKQYEKRYHSVADEIVRGVATKYPDQFISTSFRLIDLSLGLDKILDVTDSFCGKLSDKISNIAASVVPDDIRLQIAFAYQSFSSADSMAIINVMAENGLIMNHILINKGCEKLEKINFQKYNQTEIYGNCKSIQDVIQADYSKQNEVLRIGLTNLLTHSIMRMIKKEILDPFSSYASTWGANKIFENMQKAKENTMKKFGKLKEEDLLDNKPKKPDNDNNKVDDDNNDSADKKKYPKYKQAKPVKPKNSNVGSSNLKIKEFSQDILKKDGDLKDAEVLSKSLNREIIIYMGETRTVIGGNIKHPSGAPIEVYYDITSKLWSSNSMEYGPVLQGSIYKAARIRTGNGEGELRRSTSDYVLRHPVMAETVMNKHEEIFGGANNRADFNIKGNAYSEPIGPREAFAEDFDKVKAKIDSMLISEGEKAYHKSTAYALIKALNSMSEEERFIESNIIREQYRESTWDKIRGTFINDAKANPLIIVAGIYVTPEVLAFLSVLSGITYITVKNAIEQSQAALNKWTIHSTPIPERGKQNLETPAHQGKIEVETFPGEQDGSLRQGGLVHPESGFKLPGFDAEKYDDLNVLFKDNDESFTRLFGKKTADDLIKRTKDDNYLKQYQKYRKQDGSDRYECNGPSESPIWNMLKPGKHKLRTNDSKGSDKRFYRWDMKHKDIEVYDSLAREMGSIDPVTGKNYRPGSGIVNQSIKRIIK